MPAIDDMARQRALLATARIQFSSEVQPVRQIALDSIIANILYAIPTEKWTNADRVRDAFRQDSGGYVLGETELEQALHRLILAQTVEGWPRFRPHKFRLTSTARARIAQVESEADRRLDGVLRRLFGTDRQGYRRYRNCFLDILSGIFGLIGEETARLIHPGNGGDGLPPAGSMEPPLKVAKSAYPELDHELIRSALETFFRDDDPDYDGIKWNLAQNLYLAKALGLDPTGALLSKEMFQGAVFYLDTNLIIPALEPTHRGHGWFKTLVRSTQALNAQLCVCPTTLDELEGWLAAQRDLFDKVGTRIPDDVADDVDSLFLDIYETARKRGKELSTDEVFASFDDPRRTLAESYGVTITDDPWFHDANLNGRLDGFARSLQERSRSENRRAMRLKRPAAARHDAKVLTWVERQRSTEANGVWFVTTDRSLPKAVPDESEASSLAITASSLLQWLSPLLGPPNGNGDFATGFSQMIRERLLPRDRILDLNDFLVFYEMHIDIKELPAEDVKRTLRQIKAEAPHLDQSNPEDLQQISRIVARNLVDPGSKHKQAVSKLESDLAAERTQREREREEREQAEKEHDDRIAVLVQEREDERARADDERQRGEQERQQIAGDLADLKEEKRQAELVGSANIRLVICGLAFLIVIAVVTHFADQYGSGVNNWQRRKDFAWYYGVAAALVVFFGGWFVGLERLKARGWPFKSLFRAET